MKNPGFYCINFIECNSNLKMYQPRDCEQQCNKCMDEIIDHHFNKTQKAGKKESKTVGNNFLL